MALFVAGSVEALVPGHRFFVDGGVALYTGPVLAQGAAGVVVRLW